MNDDRMPEPEPVAGATESEPAREPLAKGGADPADPVASASVGLDATSGGGPAPAPEPASVLAPAPPVEAPEPEPAETPEPEPVDIPEPPAAAAQLSEFAPAPPAPASPVVEAPSPDIALAQDASPLPGAHRGGFFRLPTGPVAVTVETAPAEPGTEIGLASETWLASGEPAVHRGLAGWALVFAILGLAVALFVGWGFPIGLVAIASAILALRRPLESRPLAIWALAIGVVSVLYSVGWLLYAAMQSNFFA